MCNNGKIKLKADGQQDSIQPLCNTSQWQPSVRHHLKSQNLPQAIISALLQEMESECTMQGTSLWSILRIHKIKIRPSMLQKSLLSICKAILQTRLLLTEGKI